MAKRDLGGPNAPIARRCAIVQEIFRENQTEFAKERLRIPDVRRWNNVLCGKALSRDMAFRLVRALPGLAEGWLYRGDANQLTVELQIKLTEAANRLGLELDGSVRRTPRD